MQCAECRGTGVICHVICHRLMKTSLPPQPRFGYHQTMPDTPDMAFVAGSIADPTRSRMLMSLMRGQALTATELALDGGVTPSTASSHLGRLIDAGLVSVARQGRHRYFRIARPEVAAMLEGIANLASSCNSRIALGPRDPALRHARVCYDHLAGATAVRLLERLREYELLVGDDDSLALSPRGETWATTLGIDLETLTASRRLLCRPCLDWSERRTHLAGSLGAAILDRMVALRYVRRTAGRAVTLSENGARLIERPDTFVRGRLLRPVM
jgi:DNA-binding transcriptional ArsR family regulator